MVLRNHKSNDSGVWYPYDDISMYQVVHWTSLCIFWRLTIESYGENLFSSAKYICLSDYNETSQK